jgi:hypothetical protein
MREGEFLVIAEIDPAIHLAGKALAKLEGCPDQARA